MNEYIPNEYIPIIYIIIVILGFLLVPVIHLFYLSNKIENTSESEVEAFDRNRIRTIAKSTIGFYLVCGLIMLGIEEFFIFISWKDPLARLVICLFIWRFIVAYLARPISKTNREKLDYFPTYFFVLSLQLLLPLLFFY